MLIKVARISWHVEGDRNEVLKKRMFAYDASKRFKGESAYCSKPKTYLILPDDHCIANRYLTKLIITDNCNK